MDWQSDAIILSVRKHGETSAIVDLFSEEKGRHAGLVRGGISRKMRPLLQPGNSVRVEWRARLDNHLGSFSVEPLKLRVAELMEDRLALAGLNAACAVAREVLPERQPSPQLYAAFDVLMNNLSVPEVWPAIFIRWELGLLSALGYGLDLKACAATGGNDQLIYVSPRSGRAVSASAGEPYKDKLYPLPGFLLGEPQATPEDIGNGLALTGYFLESRIMWEVNRPLPDARERMVSALIEAGYAQPRSLDEESGMA
jgi:DNA repair protein RecO (recombination protein O)